MRGASCSSTLCARLSVYVIWAHTDRWCAAAWSGPGSAFAGGTARLPVYVRQAAGVFAHERMFTG